MKTLKKLAVLYAILLAAFTALIVLVFCLPAEPIKRHAAESARQVSKEGVWWKPCGVFLFQVDNMTDCIMMGISACDNQKSPVRAAMLDERAVAEDPSMPANYQIIDKVLLQDATGGHGINTVYEDYARYWHGYQVVLRPLLCVLNYRQIRIANYILLSLLAIGVVAMLARKTGKRTAAAFAATLLLSNFMIVPMAMQFSTCFYIAFASMLLLLCRPALARSDTNLALLFFAIGGVCSYMDFLTTPVITLGLPLTVICLLGTRTRLADLLRLCASWTAGYGLLWASKWIVARIATGYNVADSAIHSAETRVGSTIVFGGKEMQMTDFMGMLLEKTAAHVGWATIIIATAAMAAAAFIAIYSTRKTIRQNSCLVAVALMPLIWFAVMKNHSIQHIFFTWRDWILTLWVALLLIMPRQKPRKL